MDSLGGTIFLGKQAGLRLGVMEVRGPQEGVTVYGDEEGEIKDETFTEFESVDVFQREDQAFIDAVREGKPSPIDPDGVLLTNVIIPPGPAAWTTRTVSSTSTEVIVITGPLTLTPYSSVVLSWVARSMATSFRLAVATV